MNLLETIEVVAACVLVGVIGALVSIGLFAGIVYGVLRLYWWFIER